MVNALIMDVIWGNDGKIYTVFKGKVDIEEILFFWALVLLCFIFTHYTPKELWNKIRSYFKDDV